MPAAIKNLFIEATAPYMFLSLDVVYEKQPLRRLRQFLILTRCPQLFQHQAPGAYAQWLSMEYLILWGRQRYFLVFFDAYSAYCKS